MSENQNEILERGEADASNGSEENTSKGQTPEQAAKIEQVLHITTPETRDMEVQKHTHDITYKTSLGEYLLELCMLFLREFLCFNAQNIRKNFMEGSKFNLTRKFVLITSILQLLSLFSSAQNKDSLLRLIPTVKNEQERIRIAYLIIGDSGDNDPLKALYYYKKSLEASRQIHDKVLEAVITAEMGYAFYFMGNTVKGTEMMLDGARMAEKEDNQQAIGIAYDNLCFAYDDPIKKRELLLKALTASTAAKDYSFMCHEYNNLSVIYNELKQPDSANYYVQRHLELSMSQKIEESTPFALISMGWVCYRRGQKPLALEYFHSAEREPFTAKDAKTAGNVYYSLSAYYFREKNSDSSLYYARKDYEATKNAFYTIQMPATALLSNAFDIHHQSDSALKYMKRYLVMNDSMNNKLKRQQIQSQLLSEEERQLVLNEERKNYLQYSAIAMGIILLLIAFFIFSHSIIANQKYIRFLGILSLLLVFEFLNLLLHPLLEKFTHHETFFMLVILVVIAALLIPLHHKLEHWIIDKMVEKNNRIRLAAAKKTIAKLEG
jgi:tetratricopeptide (TPR) repeat protein